MSLRTLWYDLSGPKSAMLSFLFLILPMVACDPPQPIPPAGPPMVDVSAAVKTDSVRELRLSGSLSAARSMDLSFATVGTVKAVKVEEGEAVAKGQVLATLASRSYRDALGIAKAKAAQAEDAYNRLLPMYRNNTAPAVKMVEIETGREQARLSVSMAQKNLSDTVLRASVSGIVAKRHVEAGASAAPGIPAFTLVQTETLKATAPVPEKQVGRISVGDTARVTVPALDRTFSGVVREIGLIANPLTRTYDVEIAVPNPEGVLRVGMIAEVHLRVESGEGGVVVPPEAVRVDENGASYVFVVSAEKILEQRRVEIDKFVGEGTALREGLGEGERVVTSGTPMLADGMTVRVSERSTRLGTVNGDPGETKTATTSTTAAETLL